MVPVCHYRQHREPGCYDDSREQDDKATVELESDMVEEDEGDDKAGSREAVICGDRAG